MWCHLPTSVLGLRQKHNARMLHTFFLSSWLIENKMADIVFYDLDLDGKGAWSPNTCKTRYALNVKASIREIDYQSMRLWQASRDGSAFRTKLYGWVSPRFVRRFPESRKYSLLLGPLEGLGLAKPGCLFVCLLVRRINGRRYRSLWTRSMTIGWSKTLGWLQSISKKRTQMRQVCSMATKESITFITIMYQAKSCPRFSDFACWGFTARRSLKAYVTGSEKIARQCSRCLWKSLRATSKSTLTHLTKHWPR